MTTLRSDDHRFLRARFSANSPGDLYLLRAPPRPHYTKGTSVLADMNAKAKWAAATLGKLVRCHQAGFTFHGWVDGSPSFPHGSPVGTLYGHFARVRPLTVGVKCDACRAVTPLGEDVSCANCGSTLCPTCRDTNIHPICRRCQPDDNVAPGKKAPR